MFLCHVINLQEQHLAMAFASTSMRIQSHSEQPDLMDSMKTKGGATESIYGKVQHRQKMRI